MRGSGRGSGRPEATPVNTDEVDEIFIEAYHRTTKGQNIAVFALYLRSGSQLTSLSPPLRTRGLWNNMQMQCLQLHQLVQCLQRCYWHLVWHKRQSWKELNWVICREVDGPRDCHTEWSKSERQILYINTCMWTLKKLVWTILFTKQKKRHRHREQIYWYPRGKRAGMNWETRIDLFTLLILRIPEEDMATHSIVLAWGSPWTREPGGLQVNGVTGTQTQLKWLSTQARYYV